MIIISSVTVFRLGDAAGRAQCARDARRGPPAVVVRGRVGRRRRDRARLDAQERVADTDQQPAGGRVAHGVRPGPQFHQAGRAEEPSQGTGADVHHAGDHHHQHGTVQAATAHRAADHGAPPAPEPHGRPRVAVQVVRHAHLHQRVLVGHTRAAADLQDQEDEHIQKLRHPSHHRHETVDAHAHRSVYAVLCGNIVNSVFFF